MSTIFWLLIGYFMYRSVRNLLDSTQQPTGFNTQFNQAQQRTPFRNFSAPEQRTKPSKKSDWQINRGDIEDAEWEELD